MSCFTFNPWLLSMKRLSSLTGILLVATAVMRLSAQETAAGDQAATPAPATSSQPSGPLTPPPDNAPAASTPAVAPTPTPAPAATTSTTTTTTSTTSTTSQAPTEMTPREIARIQQQEVIRRQELIFTANQALSAGHKAELGTNYPVARKNYLYAAQSLGSISRSTASYSRAAEGLTRVDFCLYDDALKMGDTARAKQLMEEVVLYNPNNKLANERLVAINKAIADPNDTSMLGNPAVTPGFVKKVNQVDQLFAEAEQFRRTGQWDQAEERLKRILGLDPDNITATKQLEIIVAEKAQYADKARIETRDERLRQVEEKWYPTINNLDPSSTLQESQAPLVLNTSFGLDQKLRSIFVSLDFTSGTTIEQATNFLSIESKRLDPEHKGVNFIIQPEASTNAKPISLTLSNVPLGEALRYVCQLANVKFKVQDYAISIVPFTQSTEDLISKTFIVQPNFVQPPNTTPIGTATTGFGARPIAPVTPVTTSSASGDTVRSALEAKGIKFTTPGSSAVYTSTTGQLTVVNTADQMDLLEELVNAGQAPTLMVRIATKFVEINQTDLNDLTINTAFNPFAITGSTSSLIKGTSFTTALPGALGFAPDSIDNLISPQSLNFNTIYYRGFLGPNQYNVVINALSQKKSFDLLSEPAVITKSGDQGVMESVRSFPYPIAFDPPELQTQTTNQGGVTTGGVIAFSPPAVIATTPTDFKRRNVGVRLVIKPQITADNKTIDLSLFPEVTDFEGFINYGSEINIPSPDNLDAPPAVLSKNEINQPVFNVRRINTKVLIKDGSTVVLGGLIREDMQNINDKVPFLGDLPLVGRIFQSKATESTKKNLIIFVTANIYRNDGELLNPPEIANAADILTGRASFTPIAHP